MNQLKIIKTELFNSTQCDFWENDNGDIFMTREQIGSALEYSEPVIAISKIHNRHKERLDKFSVVTKLVSTDGKRYETTLYTAKGIYEICRWSQQPKADAFYDWVYELLEDFRKGNYPFSKPQTIEDLIIMQAQSVKELKAKVEIQDKQLQEQSEKLQVINHRVDNLDNVNISGDLQQRLNKMVKRYAWQNGLKIIQAWKDFDQAFNTAYRTNLTARRNNYAKNHGFKGLTRPQYLSLTNQLEDAIRVADKMLNTERKVI